MNEIIKKLEAEQMKAEAERMIRQYGCSEKELSRQQVWLLPYKNLNFSLSRQKHDWFAKIKVLSEDTLRIL